jgi:hypothetical protein
VRHVLLLSCTISSNASLLSVVPSAAGHSPSTAMPLRSQKAKILETDWDAGSIRHRACLNVGHTSWGVDSMVTLTAIVACNFFTFAGIGLNFTKLNCLASGVSVVWSRNGKIISQLHSWRSLSTAVHNKNQAYDAKYVRLHVSRVFLLS